MPSTFSREHCKPIHTPSEKKLRLELARIRLSFARLTKESGQFVQTAGGPGLFMLERHDIDGRHYRGFQETPIASHPDGTTLAFSGGTVVMARRDWFLIDQIAEIFCAFSENRELPPYLHWNEVDLGFSNAI